jgi:hypothetical protein
MGNKVPGRVFSLGGGVKMPKMSLPHLSAGRGMVIPGTKVKIRRDPVSAKLHRVKGQFDGH